MMAQLAFELGSTIALLGWLSLILGATLPSQRISYGLLLCGGRVIPFLLSLIYLFLLVKYWGSAPEGNYSSLVGVGLLFESQGNLAAGWLHFLIFDLFIGRWMIDDLKRSGKARWRLLPCLPLTFMYGPVGLVLYFVFQLFDKPNDSVLYAR